MQKFMVAFVTSLVLTTAVVAAPEMPLGTPLIVKETGGGFVPPEHPVHGDTSLQMASVDSFFDGLP